MTLPDFTAVALPVNVLLFLAAGVAVWLAGTRLARLADALARRTGLGQAFLGALLLGGITSLPEGATTVVASAIGNAPLAANNLFGGIAMQMAILAVADAATRGRALSATIDDSSVLLQGVLLIAVLAVAAAGIIAGDTLLVGVGVWTSAVLASAVGAFYLVHRHADGRGWTPRHAATLRLHDAKGDRARGSDMSGTALGARICALSVVILVAGVLLAHSADALAVQTGIGAEFTGVALVAVATSLPEVSTTLGAVRVGAYAMAISNVIGANILDTAILFLADAVYPGGPVLNELGSFSAFAALLGVLVTSVYLAGAIHRQKRTIAGLGIDSIAVAVLYVGGLVLLYAMR